MNRSFTICFCYFAFFLSKAQTRDTLVDVGKFNLHFNIEKGNGMPILFESGNGDDGTVWKDILKNLKEATEATLITYDRSGLGISGIDTTQLGLLNEVKALEKGLKKLGYDKDIFVVCHSFGSFYTTLFAKRNADKVKGIVFIDVLTPCFFTKDRAMDTKNSISNKDWKMLKKDAVGLYYVLQNLDNIYESSTRINLPEQIRATVIGAENPPQIVKENEREEWINCLKKFGQLRNHSYVLARKCGHKVWQDNPELVITEICKLYKKVSEK